MEAGGWPAGAWRCGPGTGPPEHGGVAGITLHGEAGAGSGEGRRPHRPQGRRLLPFTVCQACPLRTQCTTSTHGRSVQIHPDERLLAELRQRQLTAHGRAELRERVAVEHTLAQIGRWQGRRARYLGQPKNLFDLRRCAVVHNLHVIARAPWASQQAA